MVRQSTYIYPQPEQEDRISNPSTGSEKEEDIARAMSQFSRKINCKSMYVKSLSTIKLQFIFLHICCEPECDSKYGIIRFATWASCYNSQFSSYQDSMQAVSYLHDIQRNLVSRPFLPENCYQVRPNDWTVAELRQKVLWKTFESFILWNCERIYILDTDSWPGYTQ